MKLKRATHNPDLPFIKNGWEGNILNVKNQYVNLDGASEKTFKDLYKWQKQINPLKKLKRKQTSTVEVVENNNITRGAKNAITWLGHASFVFSLQKIKIITDPVFYGVGPVKRYTKLPCKANNLDNIDIILLSHNHRDHCDKKSMQQLCKLNPNAIILTGLGIAKLLKTWKIKNEIVEMGWYQQFIFQEKIKLTYLPAKHWNRRGLKDLNEMLWGSFMIESNDQNIYFGADSGLGKHFKEIAKLFPKIEYAILGIGAYMPEWFMATSHTSPEGAIKAFEDLEAKCFIPMHHGTFDLSDEPIFYPLQIMNEIIDTKNLKNIINLKIGEKLIMN